MSKSAIWRKKFEAMDGRERVAARGRLQAVVDEQSQYGNDGLDDVFQALDLLDLVISEGN